MILVAIIIVAGIVLTLSVDTSRMTVDFTYGRVVVKPSDAKAVAIHDVIVHFGHSGMKGSIFAQLDERIARRQDNVSERNRVRRR